MFARESPFQTGPSLNQLFAMGRSLAESDRGGRPQPHDDGGPATVFAGENVPQVPLGTNRANYRLRANINAYGALVFVRKANIIRGVEMHNCRLQALMVTCTRPQF